MPDPTAATSMRPYARTTGVVYLLYFVTAIVGALCAKGLVVYDAAAATARNILAHEFSYRLSFSVSLIANAFYVALVVLLYELFRPVSRRLALLAISFGLIGCTVQVAATVFQLAPLVFFSGGNRYLQVFPTEQLQAMTLALLRFEVQAFTVGLVFFALFCLFVGYLIYISTFLPGVLGVLLMLAGVGWLTYLWPPAADSFSHVIQPIGFLAELAFMLWLITRGVDMQRWSELAARKA